MYFKTDRLGAFQSADNRAAGKVNLRSGLMVLSLVGGLLAMTLLLSFGLRWQVAIVGALAVALFVLALWDPAQVLKKRTRPESRLDVKSRE